MILTLVLTAAAQVVVDAESPPVNGQFFNPSIDATHTLWTDDSGRAPDGYFLGKAVAHYMRDPVVYERDSGEVVRVLGDVLQFNAIAGFTKGPIRFGIDLPVVVRSFSDQGEETGIGDVALDVKASLVDRETKPVGLGLLARVTAPTATVDAPLGDRGFGLRVGAIVDKTFGDVLVAGNVGMKIVPGTELENFKFGSQLVAKLGLGWALSERSGISLDVVNHLNLSEVNSDSSPVEALLGGWGGFGSTVIRGGVGTGLTPGFGAPVVRVVLGIGFEPPRISDTDGDGIVDKADGCPEVPEDLDGFADDDGCPEPTAVVFEAVDAQGEIIPTASISIDDGAKGSSGVESLMNKGTYQLKATAPGYLESSQSFEVPDGERHRVRVTLERAMGILKVAVIDPAGQAIPGATWHVQGVEGDQAGGGELSLDEGSYQVMAKAPGFRSSGTKVELPASETASVTVTLQPAKVELTGERIDIKDSVYFETGKAVIKAESFGLLDEVAQVITEHPELLRIRIEGHTDSRGSARANLGLSKERAASVRTYLVAKGVAEGRLESEGYGEAKPLERANNEAAWAKNRRVDFFVAQRAD